MRSARLFGVVAFAVLGACGSDGKDGAPGAAGGAGATGPAGSAADVAPSVGVVVPSSGFLERELDVSVSVDAAKVDAATTADFGAGITVASIVPSSSSVLKAHVKIDAAATLGLRDVKVTIGGRELVSRGAFEVKPGMSLQLTNGAFVGGGLVRLDVQTGDLGTDLASRMDGGLTLVRTESYYRSTARTVAWAIVDPRASATISPRLWIPDPYSYAVERAYRAGPIAVTPVASVPLAPTSAAPVTKAAETFAAPFATHSYDISTTEAGILRVRHAGSPGLRLGGVLYGPSGKSEDMIDMFGITVPELNVPLAGPTNHHWTTFDPVGAAGVTYDLTASVLAAPLTVDAGNAHGTAATAQPVTVTNNAAVIDGQIAAGEVDVYQMATTASTRWSFYADGDLSLVMSASSSLVGMIGSVAPDRLWQTDYAYVAVPNLYFVVRARTPSFGQTNVKPAGKYRIALYPQ